jgi:hypothetical protein
MLEGWYRRVTDQSVFYGEEAAQTEFTSKLL